MNQLEIQFRSFMKKYGHHVLLLHSDSKMTCTCVDKVTGSADRGCPYCFGMGSVPLITKEVTRDIDLGTPDGMPFLGSQQLFGDLSVPARAYFFHKDTKISHDDLIIDVDWNGQIPVYNGKGIYEVSHIDPARYLGGEIVFQKVYVKDRPIMKNIRGFTITQRAGQVLYQLAEGGE